MIHEEKTQTTCVLRLFGAPLWAVQQAVQQTGLAAQFRSRGAETLAALQAETPTALSKARKALADRFAAELYGEGEMTLVHAAVQALETHRRLLVCCDADAGTLLEARMETVAGAEKVFDFGAMSYADAKVREKLSAKVCRVKGGPVPANLPVCGQRSALWVQTMQPGVWSAPRTRCCFWAAGKAAGCARWPMQIRLLCGCWI